MMWALFRIEWAKLWKRPRFLLFVLAVFCVNLFSFLYVEYQDVNIPLSSIRQVEQTLEQLPNAQRYEFVCAYAERISAFMVIERLDQLRTDPIGNRYLIAQLEAEHPDVEKTYRERYEAEKDKGYTAHLESEYELITAVKAEMDQLHDYQQYLQRIADNAEVISSAAIFQHADAFDRENVLKSSADYQDCQDIDIVYVLEKGVQDAVSFPMTRLLMIVSMFVITAEVIGEEKDKGLLVMIKAAPGRRALWAKLMVMIFSIGVLSALFMGSQLICMGVLCGLGPLNRSIQSLAAYQQCPLKTDVLTFLGMVFVLKWIGASCLGLLMFALAIRFDHQALILSIVAAFMLIEHLLWAGVDPLGPFVLLKYLNFAFILQAEQVFQLYLNVDIAQHAVSLHVLIAIFVLVIFTVLILCSVFLYQRRPSRNGVIRMPRARRRKRRLCASLFHQEWYKVLWMQKGIILMIAVVCLNAYQWANTTIYRTPEQLTMMQYMQVLAGPLNAEKVRFIESEQLRMTQLEAQLDSVREKEERGEISREQSQSSQDRIEAQLSGKAVFETILAQYAAMQEDPAIAFIDPTVYEAVLFADQWTMLPAILTLTLLLISSGGLYVDDQRCGMQQMIEISAIGKKTVNRNKRIITAIITFVFLLSMNVFMVMKLQQTYGSASMMSAVQSIEALRTFPIHMPILALMGLHFLLQYFALLSAALICSCLAKILRHGIAGVFAACLLFVVPLILSYGGYHFLDAFSLYPLIMNGPFLQSGQGLIHLLICTAAYGGIACALSIRMNRRNTRA